MKSIEILHEDDISLVVNKPAGLAVQGGKGVKTSLDRLLAEMRSDFRTPPPLLVHRLDKDTSGVLLTAKGKTSAARFSLILSTEGKAIKQYIAVCKGQPVMNEGVINEELKIHGKIKKSITKFKVIKTGIIDPANCEYSVLEIELGTGRMHQIRRHLAMTGNPILGDDKYGDFALNKLLYKTIKLKKLLLHASRLVIRELNIDVSAKLPEYFENYYGG